MANGYSTRKPTTKQHSLITRARNCTTAHELALLIAEATCDKGSIYRLTRNELDILENKARQLFVKPTTSEGGAE